MRAWGLPEEFWAQERVQRLPGEKSWQAVRWIQFGRQVISRGAEDAERPKFHLQPVVDVAHQGAHRQDLRKQELRTIAKIKVTFELYLQNIVHFAAETPRESTAKNTQKASSFADFWQFSTTCRRVEFTLRNFAIYCESLSFSQQWFRKVFAKFF